MQIDAGISGVSVVTFARGGGAAPPRNEGACLGSDGAGISQRRSKPF